VTEHVPPQNLEAEAHVLGAMLLSPGAIGAVSDIVQADDFYRDSNAKIYRAALTLHGRGEPVDAITLTDHLDAQGELEQVGGRVKLYELAALVPATANAAHYARIVHETATLRGLIRAGSEIARLGWERPGETEKLVEQAEGLVYELANHRRHAQAVDLPGEVERVYGELVALQEAGPRDLVGLPSGLHDLDVMTRGFRPGDLTVIAARTGVGKSALALYVGLKLATAAVPVAFFSLEMSETELIMRAISLRSGISHDRLERADLTPEEWRKVADACEWLVTAPITLWTDGSIRPSRVRSDVRKWRSQHPGDAVVIVDYLQLLTPDDRSDSRATDVAQISRTLKTTAMETGAHVIALSQLRRPVTQNDRPHLHELRESGAIENDSSVVVLIHRTDEKPGEAELIVAKNRHGRTGVVNVAWNGERMRFSNLLREVKAA
jgi:replicative DNA helicase